MSNEVCVELVAELESVRAGRLAVARMSGLSDDALAEAQLVTSELLANAIVHGGAADGEPVTLAVRNDGDGYLRIEVDDHGDFAKRLDESYLADGPGIGLRLVDELCDYWEARAGRVTAWYPLDRAERELRRRAHRQRHLTGARLV